MGKRERRARKENKRRRWSLTTFGADVPGGAATYGPFGKRHGRRFHRREVANHDVAVRKADALTREGRTLPKVSGGITEGAGMQGSPGATIAP